MEQWWEEGGSSVQEEQVQKSRQRGSNCPPRSNSCHRCKSTKPETAEDMAASARRLLTRDTKWVVLHCTVSSFQAGNVFSLRQLLPPNTEAGPALGSGKPGRKRGAGELPPPQHLARRQALGQTPTPSHPPLRPQAGELLQACGSRWRPGMRLNTVQRSGQPQQQRTAQPSAVVETPALGKCKSRRDSHPAPHPQQQQPRD
ncbi:uncharacterized protein LOC123632557 isoform X3 [Lemur catta]|uniref:uncharacterized protein LOC123632557 isoform X3 n=1 Tax=Lemur catta TaxID=9447 RepID=UPI001E269FF4|nr:uncharacterized protein LOC123632557 isoform X3 [Lemur catta]